MKNLILKCWNGIYGATSFEITGWERSCNDILEAGAYYKDVWGHCWIEDTKRQCTIFYPKRGAKRTST